MEKKKQKPRIQDLAIAELEEYGLDTKTLSVMDEAGFTFLSQILYVPKEDLQQQVPNLGVTGMERLLVALKRHREVHGW